ncbi:hypothetical protein SPRG_06195 [Saprolegnia parasitica CBS 223.65]|uniref:Uncharacterized protein n=1 Tax=Saprolegnia parasitica (strain CBS 223.65) TaxID=695850 RepID=A0A067CCD3_SAPPC|nr:hypothetical protein SPRG_06195 [Saprolegnia parasitica CBS 223.65]KDO28148.1 hypothetical protein SPRG_06195 [Saprolegnia parasitica CBS 223.65]|eukprot:XP_012200975.1 hypothetical protein SPRG_06195 [Saprolegnia parasitica CBS 223.65]
MAIGFGLEFVNGKWVLRSRPIEVPGAGREERSAQEAAIIDAVEDAITRSLQDSLAKRKSLKPFFLALPDTALAYDGPWLTLTVQHPLLTDMAKIYLRQCFFDVVDTLVSTKMMILTGDDGVGQSVCLLYLLWQLVVQKTPRVLYLHGDDTVLYDGLRGVFEYDTVENLPHTHDITFWGSLNVLVDTKGKTPADLAFLPRGAAHRLVLAAGPAEIATVQPIWDQAVVYELPAWSQAELDALAAGHSDQQ